MNYLHELCLKKKRVLKSSRVIRIILGEMTFWLWSQRISSSFLTEACLVAQMVKNPPAMGETWVQPLGWEDPLEEGMATHSSILAWRIPVDRGAWRATVLTVTESDTTEN